MNENAAFGGWPSAPTRGIKEFGGLRGHRPMQIAAMAALAALATAEVKAYEAGEPTGDYDSPYKFTKHLFEAWQKASEGASAPMESLPSLADLVAAGKRPAKKEANKKETGADEAKKKEPEIPRKRIFGLTADVGGYLLETSPAHGLLSPLPGDIVVFGGGHVAIVVTPRCQGCRDFEVAEWTCQEAQELGEPAAPRVTKVWISNVRRLWRPVVLPKKESTKRGAEDLPAKAAADVLAPAQSGGRRSEDGDRKPSKKS